MEVDELSNGDTAIVASEFCSVTKNKPTRSVTKLERPTATTCACDITDPYLEALQDEGLGGEFKGGCKFRGQGKTAQDEALHESSPR